MDAMAVTPCVVIHAEATQVPRFAQRVTKDHEARVLSIASPLIYVRPHDTVGTTKLREALAAAMGSGRIAAHRIYQLDWSVRDAGWIPYTAELQAMKATAVFRVAAFPNALQVGVTALLQEHGFRLHPTQFTHELHVVTQASVSSFFHVGVVARSSVSASHEASSSVSVAADAPCRAYFKIQEALRYVDLQPGDQVLDIGASPGGWTECLVAHGAHVVAVDPGELTIELEDKPIVHLPLLLEDALPTLERMDRQFALMVCDINARVQHMASLIHSVAHLLRPSGRVVLTLKLGKKPTVLAIEQAVEAAKRTLDAQFQSFQVVWLHANTQNERTLLATKRDNALLPTDLTPLT